MASSLSSKGSLLPFDLLESIFYRVPAKSLNQFKSTCKIWLNLLKDKRFAYNHLDLVQEHFIYLSDMVHIINPETNACFSLPFPDEVRAISSKTILMHCGGLLLCLTEDSSKLALWNPFFNQVRWILKPNRSFSSLDIYGFGYDNISRDNYKILRVRQDCITNEYDPTFEIYEFKSDSWRTIDAPLNWILCHSRRGVSVKGNMYWMAKSEPLSRKRCIRCFNFSIETFKLICPFPYEEDEEGYGDVDLSAYREDKLSLLRQRAKPDQSWDIEVWITNNVKDRVVSWIKLYVVSRPGFPMLGWSSSSAFIQYFIDKYDKLNVMSTRVDRDSTDVDYLFVFADLYIIGKDGFQTKETGRHIFCGLSGYVYLPSLVPVPKKGGYVKINL